MSVAPAFVGGCLCGAVRYAAEGPPLNMGVCYCDDCRKASGSGFIPFIGFSATAISFSGATLQFKCKAFRGGEAVRNSCRLCGSLVFGGSVGVDAQHTIYAGTLDDPSLFKPTLAIFMRDKPDWAPTPDGVKAFATLPER
jgi:hypothetical protein